MAEVFEQYGPYKRIRRLGIGGMAETFLAVQRGAAGFEQRVCMKFILPGYRGNADFKRLFLREASIAASLRHSNIVGVIDVDAAIGYMVLELVDGVDLRTLVNAAPGRKLPPELAVLVTVEMCKALAYAHGRVRRGQADGIVHRDVSPSNVLVSYAGEVKLTDFGVARAMRADVEPLSTTVKGKLCYMSPEQARGQLLDGRSDLFSLGVVFYELLCGRRPFDGNSDAETLLRVTSGQFTPLREAAPEVPPGLAQVAERMIHRDREQRYASADACIDALTPFTPRLTSFRQLGEMAKAARPHETLVGADIEAIDSFPSANPPLADTLLQTQALPGNTLPPRMQPPGLPEPGVAPVTRSQTTQPTVHRNAWIALGVSFTLLLVVGFAWVTRISQQREESSAMAALHTVKPAEPQAVEQPVPPPTAAPTAAGSNIELIPVMHEPEPQQQPQRIEPAPVPQPQRSLRGAATAPKSDATLDVGVVPWGKVWIDNKLYGWTPIRGIKLHPGRHTIGAGTDASQQVRKKIDLKPGEQHVLTLQLDGSGGADDATNSRSDR
jgi:eukaryotic-like serine/threonine-protein kinase